MIEPAFELLNALDSIVIYIDLLWKCPAYVLLVLVICGQRVKL